MTKNDDFIDYYCPTEPGMQALSGKWKSPLIWLLGYGPRRFSELLELMPGVSRQVLSDRLKEMEADSLVIKRVYSHRPERFEYELTERGRDLAKITKELCQWGMKHFPNANFAFASTFSSVAKD